ncbi:hypothetical protein BKA56DRAFT_493382 [Ilyonectria sp. MPI-CAGE-AT-0026]|nr:hypothetical protein BKA56DRAFT_493382 [Ilyonectria sp. MPI-CAGE-AT-0026]
MVLQFKSDFRFDMDGSFSLYGQPMPYPFTSTSFSSASSSYDPFTPTPRHKTLPAATAVSCSPHELSTMEFDSSYSNGSHRVELALPSTMGNFMFGPVVKKEPEQMPFPNTPPNTPVKGEPTSFDYTEMNLEQNGSMGSLTPSNSFDMYASFPETVIGATSFMMTPTQMLSGSEAADTYSSWSCPSDSLISFPREEQFPGNYEVLDIDHQSLSPCHFHVPTSPKQMRAQRKMMVNKIQRNTTELCYAQIRTTRKPSVKPDSAPVDVVQRAMCKCDYPSCHKTFRRTEHLKRHKQTSHGEGPNRFSCEFCGKDRFNRQDNLNIHRKLHARPNSRNRGVEFIAAAVPVIEEEECNRKRRSPPKAKQLKKRGPEYYAGPV